MDVWDPFHFNLQLKSKMKWQVALPYLGKYFYVVSSPTVVNCQGLTAISYIHGDFPVFKTSIECDCRLRLWYTNEREEQ